MAKVTLKKNKVGGLNTTWFKTYYKARIIKAMCYQCKYIKYTYRSVEQNKESRSKSAYTCSVDPLQSCKGIHWRKDSFSIL